MHEPIALIQAAAAEWAATNARSASDTADALDSTPSNLYLKAICSSKTSLVGPVKRTRIARQGGEAPSASKFEAKLGRGSQSARTSQSSTSD